MNHYAQAGLIEAYAAGLAEGKAAFHNTDPGDWLDHCPYVEGSPEQEAWIDGWHTAENESL